VTNPEEPLGPFVDARPAHRPERVTLAGRWVTLAPLDSARHAVSLYDGSNGEPERERVWTYLFDGPYANLHDFRASLETKARSEDPLFFAVIDNATGRALGYQTLMRFDAANPSGEDGVGWGLETTADTLDVVAARCGLGSAETLRRVFQRNLGVSPDAYRRRFRTAPLEGTSA